MVLLALMAVVCVQLVRVQVLASDRYVDYGEEQRLQGIELTGSRGQILDREEQALATIVPRRTVVADPRAVADPAQTARDLARLLDEDHADLYEALNREAAFAYVARQVPDDAADAVEKADIPGIWTIDEPMRYNPGDLASSLIGQTDRDGRGVSGLEIAYEDTLAGIDGRMVVERDRQGRTIPTGRREVEPAQSGEDLILTIDRTLQDNAQQVLAEHMEASGSQGGTAIVSDPGTGEILAMANMVRNDDDEIVAGDKNVALVDTYEPGSVLKALAVAAAVDEGVVAPDTMIDVPATLVRDGHSFAEERCTEPRLYSVAEILAKSCNVGMILVAEEVGAETLHDYLGEFGLAEAPGLGFPNETSGQYPDSADWRASSLATIALGQGIAVSPMQLLDAFNTIANDGLYLPPRLVGEVVDSEGERHPVPAGESSRVLATATATATRDMMSGVVSDDGTGSLAAVEGYEVAGKTGTARKPSPDGSYTWSDGYHHVVSFAGFLPADDPQVSVLVMLDEPDVDSASTTAAPAFADLARYAAYVLSIPPAPR